MRNICPNRDVVNEPPSCETAGDECETCPAYNFQELAAPGEPIVLIEEWRKLREDASAKAGLR